MTTAGASTPFSSRSPSCAVIRCVEFIRFVSWLSVRRKAVPTATVGYPKEERSGSPILLHRSTDLPDSLFEIVAHGVNWEGLTDLVDTSDMPYRDEVLNILRNTPEWIVRNGVVVDGRKRRLGMLHGGRAWQYMYEHFFPKLRA